MRRLLFGLVLLSLFIPLKSFAAPVACFSQYQGVNCGATNNVMFGGGCAPDAQKADWDAYCDALAKGTGVYCLGTWASDPDNQPHACACTTGYAYNTATWDCDLCAPGYVDINSQCMKETSVIYDADKDTIVATEYNLDEDIVRLFTGTNELLNFTTANGVEAVDESLKLTTKRTTDGLGYSVRVHGGNAVTDGDGGPVVIYGGQKLGAHDEGYVHFGGGGGAPNKIVKTPGSGYFEGGIEADIKSYFDAKLFVGDAASETDFPQATSIMSQADTGATHTANVGVVGEAVSDVAEQSFGVYGIGKTKGGIPGSGVYGRGMVDNTNDPSFSTGLLGFAIDTHGDGPNAGVYAGATGGRENYSFFGANGDIFNQNKLLINTTNPSADFPNAQAVITESDTGQSSGGKIGLIGESKANVNFPATGLTGLGETFGTKDGYGMVGTASVNASNDTAGAIGVYGSAVSTHAGGDNIGVYSNAANGLKNYSFFGANGDIFNTANMRLGADASITDFPNARAIISRGDTGYNGEVDAVGVAMEAISDGVNDAIGGLGVGKTKGARAGTGITGIATVDNGADTGTAYGMSGISAATHGGGLNVGVSGMATGGITNYAFYSIAGGFYNNGQTTYNPAAPILMNAEDSLPTPIKTLIRVGGNGAAKTLTSTPTIQDAIDGTIIIIEGTNNVNTVTFQDTNALPNSGLELNVNSNAVLGNGDTLQVMYDAGYDRWVEISRSNN